MSKDKEPLAPVVVNVVVELPCEAAFELFTRGIGDWWPTASHSVGQEKTKSAHFEPRAGGRIYEVDADGTEHEWGEVLECEPPRRVAFTWHPGRDEDTAQSIEVLFAADGEITHVELIHRDWEALKQKAEETREGYVEGWAYVLGECYVNATQG